MYLASIKDKIDDMRVYTIDLHKLTSKVLAEKEMQMKELLES